MSSSSIKTRAQHMMDDVEAAIAETNLLPGGSARFQNTLLEAEQRDVRTVDDLAKLISLANAALAVAGSGTDVLGGPWYHEMAQRLLRRSMDALAVIEADRWPRPAAGLN
ncbi:hypothetical protein [Bradyrhizobium sp. AZCC 1708]|uniref:hypothetical protein n=1 Tax=Bradyrhizobium sp. AZCC 1708 TaxID=3117015 RepID=UPI002FEEBAE4